MNEKPEWIKTIAPSKTPDEVKVGEILEKYQLNTVCREADCPNQGECWQEGTATFMLLGKICTRSCRFCDVSTGSPGGRVDQAEPERVKNAVSDLDLDYVVLTSVDRDDLPDAGASQFRATINRIKRLPDPPLVEALIPDFSGQTSSLRKVTDTDIDVVGHNIETVERLTSRVRDPRADYQLSLSVLEEINQLNPSLVTKSSIMVGLGESKEEIQQALEDLRRYEVDIVTIGQYLRPTEEQLPVEKFWDRSDFQRFREIGEGMGFAEVVSGPFVRSSYRAKQAYFEACQD